MLSRNAVLSRATSARDYAELTKPRIVVMVVLTTLAGFYMAVPGTIDTLTLVSTLLGTALVVSSANALNQLAERDTDALMNRTEGRPLPAGRLGSYEALAFGAVTLLAGMAGLAVYVNVPTALLALLAWVNYLFLYTPLKRRTTLSTVVGAVSGAIPPVIGWTAVRPEPSVAPLLLFLILFLWQFPHFMAIAWMYRDDYARAGIRVLPLVAGGDEKTGRQVIGYGFALVPACLMPTLLGFAGGLYFFGALLLGIGFLASGVHIAIRKTDAAARLLLYSSLVFLPVLFVLMTLDKRVI